VSDIVRAREILKEALKKADPVTCGLIKLALKNMTRTYSVAPVRPESRRMTPKIAKQIRAFKRENRGMSLAKIAQIWNVNPGRVSEALAKKR